MNLNKVFIIGRLTADPQLRTTQAGTQVATFSVATNRVWNDKIAGRREEAEFHNIVLWGRQAEIASRFLAKGNLVLIEGRLQTRTWEDQRGQSRKTTEVIGERLQLPPRAFNAPRTAPRVPSSEDENLTSAGAGPDLVPIIDVGEEEMSPADSETPTAADDADINKQNIKPEDLPF
jgi:single-strand DNA-binding protein